MTTNSKIIALIGTRPPYRGGIARFSVSLAEQLLDMGHDVKVISFRKQYPKLLFPGKAEKGYIKTRAGVNKNFVDLIQPYVTDEECWPPVYAKRRTTPSIMIPVFSTSIKLIWNAQEHLEISLEQVKNFCYMNLGSINFFQEKRIL